MRAVVTGAGGFVGTHLVAHLEACGDEVVLVDRSGPHPVDVTDADAVRRVIDEARPDVVYHLAARTHVGESWRAPNDVFRVNVEGTLNVVRACGELGVGRVLVVGSAEEYGRVEPGDLPLGEDAPLRPMTPYGASKVAAGFVALQAHLGAGTPTIRVRPFNHTGPGQSSRFVVPAFAHRITAAERSGTDEIPVGSLEPVRDLTDVRDVVRAYRLLARHGEPGGVYNVCSGRGVAVREVAERLLTMACRPLRLAPDPELLRPVEVPVLVGDPSRIEAATGWRPELDLDVTLSDLLAEARAGR
ncbi:MAG: GDP-mannose 4,6-dehydratase [Acidimicrobiia bacterium]|nr:GDP-mannose 4,6-dehydratase [Acidimicrobiia bacterium]